MTSIDKLIDKFKRKPRDFTWNEFLRLVSSLGYEPIKGGKTSGSRRKFWNRQTNHIISLDEPHPKKILRAYQVHDVYKALKEEGLI